MKGVLLLGSVGFTGRALYLGSFKVNFLETGTVWLLMPENMLKSATMKEGHRANERELNSSCRISPLSGPLAECWKQRG